MSDRPIQERAAQVGHILCARIAYFGACGSLKNCQLVWQQVVLTHPADLGLSRMFLGRVSVYFLKYFDFVA